MLRIESPIAPVPEQTAYVAHAAFPLGNVYLWIKDQLGQIYNDRDFVDLYDCQGQPGWSAWRLAMVCVMQFMEDLTDRQAADAVRARIDWKYALSLELCWRGFDYSILSEFRTLINQPRSRSQTIRAIISSSQTQRLAEAQKQAANRFYPCSLRDSDSQSLRVARRNVTS